MKNRTFKKKKGLKSDNFEILGHSDLQGHVMTLKVSKMNSGKKLIKKKKFSSLRSF